MKNILSSIGGLAVILGLGSFILDFINMEFTLLAWVNNWGEDRAIVIRIGLIVVGAILWFIARKMPEPAE